MPAFRSTPNLSQLAGRVNTPRKVEEDELGIIFAGLVDFRSAA